MVKYYGYYSNVSRGKRQIAERDDAIPCILEPLGDAKTFRKNWARLIRKIYEVDPLVCPTLVPAKAGITFWTGDSAKRWADFSKGRLLLHLPLPTASPAPAFRCKISLDSQ